MLRAIADVLRKNGDELAMIDAADCGNPYSEMIRDANAGAAQLDFYAGLVTEMKGASIPMGPDVVNFSVREPFGVVGRIIPFNHPFMFAAGKSGAPLAAGNTVVLKPPEQAPLSSLRLAELIDGILPPGVWNVVPGGKEVGQVLASHPDVAMTALIGSVPTGRAVMKAASETLKPVLLELGGKAPLLVLDDADLDAAVRAAAFGAFMHQGQICMSTERVVVDRRIADSFAGKFAVKAGSLTAGDPRTSNAPLGSLIGKEAADRVEALIDDAVVKGAKRLCGGARTGTIMDATVLDHVTPQMRIYHEESFGPVACIVRAENDADAIRIANDTEYGLAASVYSRDVSRALGVARRIESGICHVNGPTVQDEAPVPFGGVKASGYGKFGGVEGLNAFTTLRWLTIESQEPHYPF
jgi:acyl-CoA reductase-like NAD-dependent aldehyde dehydrogenase